MTNTITVCLGPLFEFNMHGSMAPVRHYGGVGPSNLDREVYNAGLENFLARIADKFWAAGFLMAIDRSGDGAIATYTGDPDHQAAARRLMDPSTFDFWAV